MSLILDALRKSERERQRGKAPDLFSQNYTSNKSSSRLPAAIVVTALLAIIVVGLWWREHRSNNAISEAAAESTVEAADPVPASSPYLALIPAPEPERQPANNSLAPIVPAQPSPILEAPVVATISEPDQQSQAKPTQTPSPTSIRMLETLSLSQRRQLPELRISLHVFADDPESRFVVIDGQRLREGDRFGNDLLIESIHSEGVILLWRDMRLRVAR